MAEIESSYCPECEEAFNFPDPLPVDRRNFIRVVGGTAAAIAMGAVGSAQALPTRRRPRRRPGRPKS